jgi:hypothetical protein
MNPQAGSTLIRSLLCGAEVPLASHGDAAKRDDPRKQKATQIAHGVAILEASDSHEPPCACANMCCVVVEGTSSVQKSHISGKSQGGSSPPFRSCDKKTQATPPQCRVKRQLRDAPWLLELKIKSEIPLRAEILGINDRHSF